MPDAVDRGRSGTADRRLVLGITPYRFVAPVRPIRRRAFDEDDRNLDRDYQRGNSRRAAHPHQIHRGRRKPLPAAGLDLHAQRDKTMGADLRRSRRANAQTLGALGDLRDPGEIRSLPQGVEPAEKLASLRGVMQGKNSWPNGQTIGYRGPAPPKGHGVHHYHFKLYALDSPLMLWPEMTKEAVEQAIDGHILGTGELIGTYERK